MQQLFIRLIQEEFTPLLSLPADVPQAAWARVVALADPTFLYCTAADPAIYINPDSYQQLQVVLQQELTKMK